MGLDLQIDLLVIGNLLLCDLCMADLCATGESPVAALSLMVVLPRLGTYRGSG